MVDEIRFVINHFNPRSPHGERLHLFTTSIFFKIFQSTLPARGATTLLFIRPMLRGAFQSTLPARGATCAKLRSAGRLLISIHAPRTGSDQGENGFFARKPISIHAPRTGSDVDFPAFADCQQLFQSTLPARGATVRNKESKFVSNISIHAPRTGSDSGRKSSGRKSSISIHAPRTGSDAEQHATIMGLADISIHAPRTGSDRTVNN